MPFPLAIPLITSGLSFLGGLVGNKQKSATSRNYGPLQQQLLDLIRKRLSGSADLSGYTSGGIQDINRTYDTIAQSQSNDLTARGLGTSPVAGAVDATRQNARAGSIAGFRNSIPLLQRQLQGDDLGLAASLFGGRTSTGESGGGLGGGFDSLSTMLGYLMKSGAFGRGGGGSSVGYQPNDMSGWG
jgi:hypothetical protein